MVTAAVIFAAGLLCVMPNVHASSGHGELITQDNFDAKVANSEEVWVVEFFSPR